MSAAPPKPAGSSSTLSIIRRVAELSLGLAAVAAIAHTLGGLRTPLGVAVQTAVSRFSWGLAAAVEEWPILHDASDVTVILGATVMTGLALIPLVPYARHLEAEAAKSQAARDYEGDRSEPALLVSLWTQMLAVPGAVGLLGAALWGAGLAPKLAVGTGLTLLAVAMTQTARRAGSLSRAPATPRILTLRVVPWVLGWAAFLWLHALYVSGPGIEPLPVAEDGFVDVIATALAALPEHTLLRPVADGLGVVVALFVGATLMISGFPLLPRLAAGPAGWLHGLFTPAVVAVILGTPTQLLDQWRCPAPGTGPIEWVDARPGVFQLDVAGRELWAVDRRAAETRRFQLTDGRLAATVAWAEFYDGAQPEEQWVSGTGEVWTALVSGGYDSGSVLVALDANSGVRTAAPMVVPGCWVSSVVVRDEGKEAILGCEHSGEILHLDLVNRSFGERFAIPGAGSVEELVHDPRTRHLFALPLWRGHRLLELDLQRAKPVRSRPLGDFQWSAALDPVRDALWVPRFQEGQLWRVRVDDLQVDRVERLSYGLRPIVLLDGGARVVTAATYSGRLWAVDATGDERPRSLHVGGLVRDLALAPDGTTLWLAGRCGVGRIDTRAWPGW